MVYKHDYQIECNDYNMFTLDRDKKENEEKEVSEMEKQEYYIKVICTVYSNDCI